MKPIDQLGKSPTGIEPGYRDAFHAPVVLASIKEGHQLYRGEYIRFINKELTEFVHTNGPSGAHGVLDPFVDPSLDGPFWILIKPGLTTQVAHHFQINVPESELVDPDPEEDYDDSCRGCW